MSDFYVTDIYLYLKSMSYIQILKSASNSQSMTFFKFSNQRPILSQSMIFFKFSNHVQFLNLWLYLTF
jgi:hypothetical protein